MIKEKKISLIFYFLCCTIRIITRINAIYDKNPDLSSGDGHNLSGQGGCLSWIRSNHVSYPPVLVKLCTE